MPWDEKLVMSLRVEFVLLTTQEKANVRELCRRFKITPNTAYKWIKRYKKEGVSGLSEQSRKPDISPQQTPPECEKLIVKMRKDNPSWGDRKIKRCHEDVGISMPAVSTVHAILNRAGLITASPSSLGATGRFEHEKPNDLWQMDFKGHFPYQQGHCHILTMSDDHSRFSLCLESGDNERRETVEKCLINTFERYGLPTRMTMDNGSPWGHDKVSWTGLEIWLMRQGIKVGHSRPYHPQMQGKLERFHRNLKAKVLQGQWFTDMSSIQRRLDVWRDVYNQIRPHEGIGLEVPASRYQVSPRAYNPVPEAPEYGSEMQVRKIDGDGKIYFRGKILHCGKGFARESVGILEKENDGHYSLCWYSTQIGVIDLNTGSITVSKSL